MILWPKQVQKRSLGIILWTLISLAGDRVEQNFAGNLNRLGRDLFISGESAQKCQIGEMVVMCLLIRAVNKSKFVVGCDFVIELVVSESAQVLR